MKITCNFAGNKHPLQPNRSGQPDVPHPSKLGKAYFNINNNDIIELKPQLKVSLIRRLTGCLTDEQIDIINKYRILPEDTKIVRAPSLFRFCLAPVVIFLWPGMETMPDDLMAKKTFFGTVAFVKVRKNKNK